MLQPRNRESKFYRYIYSRYYRKGDENQIDGKGWKWMGENDMFGKSADDVITSNLDKADVYTQGDYYDRVGFNGNNAKNFMSKMGYKNVPSPHKNINILNQHKKMRTKFKNRILRFLLYYST